MPPRPLARFQTARTILGDRLFFHGARLEARAYGLRTETERAAGLPITFYRGGAGRGRPVVVLLHGFSADRQVWARFARHLVEEYEVIVPDLPGHGDTGWFDDLDYGAPAHARRMFALLDALRIERAHVMGNSMGGFIAGHMGAQAPERLHTLTLIAPAGVPSPEPSEMDRMLARGENPFEIHHRGDFESFYPMTMKKPPRLPAVILDAMAEDYRRRRAQLMTMFEQLRHEDALHQRLDQIATPTLVMWGEHDRLLHVSAATVWAEGLPDARQIVYDDLGHMPMIEDPARSARDVLRFISPHATL